MCDNDCHIIFYARGMQGIRLLGWAFLYSGEEGWHSEYLFGKKFPLEMASDCGPDPTDSRYGYY